MNRLLSGDLRGLELPRDLSILRRDAEQAVAAGQPLDALYGALAGEHPIALGELVYGPKALRGEMAVRASLKVLETLEKNMQPKALYPRLVSLEESTATDVLDAAIARHPNAPWLTVLSKKLNVIPGLKQLTTEVDGGQFSTACIAHARRGHHEALLALATKGHPEPAAALLLVGDNASSIKAATLALRTRPEADVIAWLSAAGGPEIDTLLCRLLPHLQSKSAVEALHQKSTPFPQTHARLRAILPAVR